MSQQGVAPQTPPNTVVGVPYLNGREQQLMKHAHRATLAGLMFVGVLALTGCSAHATAQAPAPSSTTASAPVVETPAAPAPVVAGTVLTAEQIPALTKDQLAFTMPDGTQIAVVIGEPLPAGVNAAITAATIPLAPFGTGSSVRTITAPQSNAAVDALQASLKTSGAATGRRIIAVFPLMDNGAKLWSSTILDSHAYSTPEEQVAHLAGIVAANPAGNEVIVLN